MPNTLIHETLSYLVKILWNFDQTMKNEDCKVQNLKFKTNTATMNPMMPTTEFNKRSIKSFLSFCIFQFALCIFQSITQNPHDIE